MYFWLCHTFLGFMNIFWLHRNAEKSAAAYCDQHVIKIALEAAQLLVTALCQIFPDGSWRKIIQTEYKPTHAKHPLVGWISSSNENFLRVAEVGVALCKEYSYRWPGKTLKVEPLLQKMHTSGSGLVPCGVVSKPPKCFGTVFRSSSRSVRKSYREYYQYKVGAFKKPMRYTRRSPPKWLRIDFSL